MPARAKPPVEPPLAIIGRGPRPGWVVLLLVCGLALWAWFEYRAAALHGHGLGPVRWLLIATAAGLGLVPAVQRVVLKSLDRVRHPTTRAAEWATFGISLAATCYFVATALYQDRDLFPKTHDEGSYVIGVRMMARGRLWMDAHPLADFFDTFYVIVRPVYASLYFPGTALMYAPADWLQWPTWVMPVVAAGAAVGLAYRIVTELVDGAAAALAALLMVSLSWYRMLSVLVFSQVPLLLLALLMVWAWLRWRRGGGPGWALAVGVFAGWAAIVRPIDALCYAVPIGVAMIFDLRSLPPRGRWFTPALVVAGAVPFVALQLYFNKGVTGSAAQTPYTFYLNRDQPNTSLGFRPYDPSRKPQSSLPQKRDYYERFMLRYIREHQPSTFLETWATKALPMLVDTTLPARLLVALVPVGLIGLTGVRRRTVWATLPLFVAGYMLNTFFLEHYAAAVIPAVLLSVLLGLYALADAWPRWHDRVMSAGVLVIVVVCLSSAYELNPVTTALDSKEKRHLHAIDDETFRSPLLRDVHNLRYVVEQPAVILFTYSQRANIIEEPVYNTDVAWPDDAPVIRAHDLGERNVEIFRYYAQHQPERMFYRYDRATGTPIKLGRAKDLAGQAIGGSAAR